MFSVTAAAVLGALFAGVVWALASRRFTKVTRGSKIMVGVLAALLGLLLMWASFAWMEAPREFWWF